MLSIIVPTLNEAQNLQQTLQPLQPLRGSELEIIVADGGSDDGTLELAQNWADQIIRAPKGRAAQMNTGAKLANGSTLLFLHADAHLSAATLQAVRHKTDRATWGRFDVELRSERFVFRIIEKMMNLRSCVTNVATGDQAMFVNTEVFRQLGGFPEIALMEDVALSKKLRAISRPLCVCQPVSVSVRYWEKNGVLTSVMRMWYIRAAYLLGVSPDTLKNLYYRPDR